MVVKINHVNMICGYIQIMKIPTHWFFQIIINLVFVSNCINSFIPFYLEFFYMTLTSCHLKKYDNDVNSHKISYISTAAPPFSMGLRQLKPS